MKLIRSKWLEIIAYVFCSIFFLYGFYHLGGIITDQFNPVIKMIPMILTGWIPMAYLFLNYKNNHTRQIGKKELFVFTTIITVLEFVSLICFILSSTYYFQEPSHIIKTVLFLVMFILTLALNSYLYYLIFTHKIQDHYEEPAKEINPAFMGVRRKLWYSISSLIASFFFADFLVGIFLTSKNFLYDFWAYSYLLMLLLVPIFSLVCISLNNKNKGCKIANIISFGLNILSVISIWIVYFYSYRIVIEVGEQFFLLDFAASIPASFIFISIDLVVNSIKQIFMMIKHQ